MDLQPQKNMRKPGRLRCSVKVSLMRLQRLCGFVRESKLHSDEEAPQESSPSCFKRGKGFFSSAYILKRIMFFRRSNFFVFTLVIFSFGFKQIR